MEPYNEEQAQPVTPEAITERVQEPDETEVPPLMFSTLMRVFCADFASE